MNKSRQSESACERFKRLAILRTNEVLKRLKILGNCSNKQIYEYTDEEIKAIFSAIGKKLKEVRSKFNFVDEKKFKL